MSAFRFLAYLSPLVVGFGVPGALALAAGKAPARRGIAAGAVLGGVLLILAGAAFTESFGAFVKVAALVTAFGVAVAGTFLLAESLGLPRELCQIAASFGVVVLMGTVFCLGPVLRDAEASGLSGEAIARRIEAALDTNPFMVMGYSIFGVSLLHEDVLYPIGAADFQHAYPRWGATAAGYALMGVVLIAATLGVQALRRRLAKQP